MTSCKNWNELLLDNKSIIPPPIYKESADQALAIFKRLRISDLPGQPTFGEVSRTWVFDFVSAVFGAYNPDTGVQEINNFFLMVAKKNTKSTLSAGIMLTALLLSWRNDEEHLILAPTIEVAKNAFTPAAAMVRTDPELSARLNVRDHVRSIECRVTGNSLKIVAADPSTVGGKKAGRVLIDELWLFGKKSGASGMLMEATGGQASRPEGFTIFLTTQSDEAPAGVFKEKLNYFRKVRDGEIIDKTALPVIYEFSKEQIENKDYLNENFWHIPNPNLHKSVSIDYLKRVQKVAEEGEEGDLQKFYAKHLNVEIGLSLASDRWSGADFWEGAEIALSFDDLISKSEVITAGIDGGGLDDLLGFYAIGRTENNKKIGWGYAWASQSVLDRRKEIAPRLQDFKNLGELSIIKNMGDDVQELCDFCEILKESGKLDKIGVDPAGIGAIMDELEAREFTEKDIVGISQGWRLGGAIKTVERWLATEKAFSPAKQNLMRWCVGNAKIEQRANSIMITKQASGTAKIDPLMALFNAATLMSLNPKSPSGTFSMFFM